MPYLLSVNRTKSFFPTGDMLNVSYMAISESFIELSREALNRMKNDAMGNRSSISARLEGRQNMDMTQYGSLLTSNQCIFSGRQRTGSGLLSGDEYRRLAIFRG